MLARNDMDFHGPRERAGAFAFRVFDALFYVLLKTAENFRILLGVFLFLSFLIGIFGRQAKELS